MDTTYRYSIRQAGIEFLKTLASSRQSSAYCRVCKKHGNYIYNPDQAIPRDMFCIRGEHWQDPSLPG